MRRLLHRRIGGFRATRNFVDKGGALAVHVEKIGAIRHQAAGFGEGRVLVDRGQLGRHHQLHQLAALRIEQRRGQHKQGLHLVIGDRSKRVGEIFAARGPEHLHLETLDGGGRGCITHALFGRAGRVRIDGQRQAQRLGQQFAQHLDALLIEPGIHDRDAGDIAARPRQACHQAGTDRVVDGGHHDRHRAGRLLRGAHGRDGARMITAGTRCNSSWASAGKRS